mmetsp:Transcript_106/g.237  ORF Transcript_106/g.237 Transcript_106/m.237 type:complete len:248 (-) Transcript_106:556-1299(-)
MESLGKRQSVIIIRFHFLICYLTCGAQTNDKGRWQGSRAETTFLPTTIDYWLESYAGPSTYVDSSNTFWTVQLVTRNTHQVDVHLLDVHFDLPYSLRRVGMEKDSILSAYFTSFCDRLNDSDLIVDGHHREQRGRRSNSLLQVFKIDQPLLLDYFIQVPSYRSMLNCCCGSSLPTYRVHGQVSYFQSLLLHDSAGVQNTLVFSLRCNYMVLPRLVKISNSLHGEVVAFSRPRSEDDLLRIRVDQIRH